MADGTLEALERVQTTLSSLSVPVEVIGNPLPALPFVQVSPVADTPYNGLEGEYERFTRIQVVAWASSITAALTLQEQVRALLVDAPPQEFERLQTTVTLSDQTDQGERARGASADYQLLR